MFELQMEVQNWLMRNFKNPSVLLLQVHLTEEVGELSRAVGKLTTGIRGTQEEWTEEAYKEVGDVGLALMHVANHFGFTLESAIRDRWETIRDRDYINNPRQHGLPNVE